LLDELSRAGSRLIEHVDASRHLRVVFLQTSHGLALFREPHDEADELQENGEYEAE
jgi:hypothetical protein